MKRFLSFSLVLGAVLAGVPGIIAAELPATGQTGPPCADDNGNTNGDADTDLSDAVYLLTFLFQGGPAPVPFCTPPGSKPDDSCSDDNGNTNGDADTDLSDAVYLLTFLFQGGPASVPICQAVADPLCGVKVVAYYPHYGRYRMPVADIQYQHLTDVIFSFLRVAADGTLTADHPATLQQLVDVAHAKGVRVQASVVGEFLEMVDDGDGSRARFLSELKAMAISYDLDGIDFDWEGSAFSAAARTLYAELVAAAAAELTPLGMSLSVATVTWRNELPASALSHLTSMNCMGYDAGPPDHSSLQDGVDVVQHWVNVGASPDTLLMGTAFYARKADWSAITWADLVASYAPAPEVDAVGGWGFPGVNTTAAKVKYVMDGGFRGIMIWELSQDTLDETSLLATIGKTIRDHCSRE